MPAALAPRGGFVTTSAVTRATRTAPRAWSLRLRLRRTASVEDLTGLRRADVRAYRRGDRAVDRIRRILAGDGAFAQTSELVLAADRCGCLRQNRAAGEALRTVRGHQAG